MIGVIDSGQRMVDVVAIGLANGILLEITPADSASATCNLARALSTA
jgi:hypothetical protein